MSIASHRGMACIPGLLVAGVLATGACSSQSELVVDLETDLVPGVEFARVETSVAGASGASAGATRIDGAASYGEDFLSGRSIADLTGLDSGRADVQVRLLDASGRLVVARRTIVEVSGRFAVTVIITRDCRSVSCPGVGGDPNATQCLGGRCVPPECSPDALVTCGGALCAADSDCPQPAAHCARARCDAASGVCLITPASGGCGAGTFCDPDLGCQPVPGSDAGMPTDAGVDSGCAGGGPCDTGNPCERGTTDCSSGSPVCVSAGPASAGIECRASAGPCDVAESCDGASTTCPPDGFAPSGTSCTGGSCDGTGTCVAGCDAGTPCATGNPCAVGAIDCSTDSPVCMATGPAAAGTPCRAAAGVCDTAETCDGTSTSCPPDTFLSSSTVCRPSTGDCDPAESCTGSSPTCPADAHLADGTSCGTNQLCATGVCYGYSCSPCVAPDCMAGSVPGCFSGSDSRCTACTAVPAGH